MVSSTKKAIIKYSAFGLVIAVLAGWYYLSHTPQARIRKRMRDLTEVISKAQGEGNAAMAYKMLAFENMLADTVECQLLYFPYNGSNSANTLASLVFRGRNMLNYVSLSIIDAEYVLSSAEQAQVICAARLKLSYGDKPFDEQRNCIITMNKVGNDWKIAGFKDGNLLEK